MIILKRLGRPNTLNNTRPASEEFAEVSYENEEEMEREEPEMDRTALLILDYIQYKAARRLQSWWRSHYYRQQLKKSRWAVTLIQRWWRGFIMRSHAYRQVELALQNSIEAHYDKAAITIQALFRGWWVRQTVHDMHSLRRMQICAAEDLINCLAFKLHHLLRQQSIPGVYSLRNSICLAHVEKLLASLNYRFHNGRVRSAMANRKALSEQQRKRFKVSGHYTEGPYRGPNFNGICEALVEENPAIAKDMDRRMFKIISLYEEAHRDTHATALYTSLAERRRQKRMQDILTLQGIKRRNFCNDVIASMRRWDIVKGYEITIDNGIFLNPNNLERFLDEISGIKDELEKYTCHCRLSVTDVVHCH